MLKAIYAQENRQAADAKVEQVAAELKVMKLHKAAELTEDKIQETLTFSLPGYSLCGYAATIR